MSDSLLRMNDFVCQIHCENGWIFIYVGFIYKDGWLCILDCLVKMDDDDVRFLGKDGWLMSHTLVKKDDFLFQIPW